VRVRAAAAAASGKPPSEQRPALFRRPRCKGRKEQGSNQCASRYNRRPRSIKPATPLHKRSRCICHSIRRSSFLPPAVRVSHTSMCACSTSRYAPTRLPVDDGTCLSHLRSKDQSPTAALASIDAMARHYSRRCGRHAVCADSTGKASFASDLWSRKQPMPISPACMKDH
jgi:hypothetical protein